MTARRLASVCVLAGMAVTSCARPWGFERMPLMDGPGPRSVWLRVAVTGVEPYDVDLHVPHARGSNPMPLVIVLHGYGGTGPGMERRTRFSEAGDSAGFAVAYPNGRKNAQGRRAWSGAARPSPDVAMLQALIDSVAARAPLDRRRVYLAGFSNGGGMTYRAALAMPNTFAAIGVVAGAVALPLNDPVTHPGTPLVAVHGLLDSTVAYSGGPGRRGGAAAAVLGWAQRNGCTRTPVTDTLAGLDAIRTAYTSCPRGSSATLYSMTHGRHGWPTAATREAPMSTTAVLTRFFLQHGLDELP